MNVDFPIWCYPSPSGLLGFADSSLFAFPRSTVSMAQHVISPAPVCPNIDMDPNKQKIVSMMQEVLWTFHLQLLIISCFHLTGLAVLPVGIDRPRHWILHIWEGGSGRLALE